MVIINTLKDLMNKIDNSGQKHEKFQKRDGNFKKRYKLKHLP